MMNSISGMGRNEHEFTANSKLYTKSDKTAVKAAVILHADKDGIIYLDFRFYYWHSLKTPEIFYMHAMERLGCYIIYTVKFR